MNIPKELFMQAALTPHYGPPSIVHLAEVPLDGGQIGQLAGTRQRARAGLDVLLGQGAPP